MLPKVGGRLLACRCVTRQQYDMCVTVKCSSNLKGDAAILCQTQIALRLNPHFGPDPLECRNRHSKEQHRSGTSGPYKTRLMYGRLSERAFECS